MNTNITTKIESNVNLVDDKFLDEVINLFKTVNVSITRNEIEEFIREKLVKEIEDLTVADIENLTLADLEIERFI